MSCDISREKTIKVLKAISYLLKWAEKEHPGVSKDTREKLIDNCREAFIIITDEVISEETAGKKDD